MNQAQVYWIHLPEHTDMTKEGYIGATVEFDKRMKQHSRAQSTIKDYIIKYGWDNLVVDVVDEGTEDYCRKREYELRSTRNIGWNGAAGGLGGNKLDKAGHKKAAQSRIGNVWWTNGVDNIVSKTQPEGYRRGRTVDFSTKAIDPMNDKRRSPETHSRISATMKKVRAEKSWSRSGSKNKPK